MWSARQAEGLSLLEAENTTGYFGVSLDKPGQPKPYKAYVRRGGNQVSLGSWRRLFFRARPYVSCLSPRHETASG